MDRSGINMLVYMLKQKTITLHRVGDVANAWDKATERVVHSTWVSSCGQQVFVPLRAGRNTAH